MREYTATEAQRRKVIRYAAGCYNVRDDDPHQGRYVCPDCPDDRHVPPFRPFAFESHVREHEDATGHTIAVYCYVCCDFHTQEAMEAPLEVVWLADGPPELPPASPESVLAAMETLRRAGYLIRVASRPALPEPDLLILPYSEAETLALVRGRPGITTREIKALLGLRGGAAQARVWLLRKGGHIRQDGYDGHGFKRYYPTHDKPIGRVRPRSHTRYA